MNHTCPNTHCLSCHIKKAGAFWRKSDSQKVQRYRCLRCFRNFSAATGTPTFGQHKRTLNHKILKDLASSGSQNRMALNLNTNRKTIARKLRFLGMECAKLNKMHNMAKPPAFDVQFDEMETFEHTKCKPISIALAVEHKTRRILGFQVSSMPAKGPLAKLSRRKYGPRKDDRNKGLQELFREIIPICDKNINLLSDSCPRYQPAVRRAFAKRPEYRVAYKQTKGGRGSSIGGGEIKKLFFDPLFSLNHTCGMFRSWVNRLFRKTWNTTKKMECLEYHLHIYAYYHNTVALKKAA